MAPIPARHPYGVVQERSNLLASSRKLLDFYREIISKAYKLLGWDSQHLGRYLMHLGFHSTPKLNAQILKP
jgi:hypothetical protein